MTDNNNIRVSGASSSTQFVHIRAKTKKKRIQRILKKKEPKLFENVKNAMFIKGSTSNQVMQQVLKDLYLLKAPDALHLQKSNEIRPFEDAAPVEFLASKNDTSLFMFSSHSKKRPNNLVLGRLFDYGLLDMIELGVGNFKSMNSFKGVEKSATGNKPCFMFVGEEWDQNEELKTLRNILIDFFRGAIVETINLAGLEHVIVCSTVNEKVFFRVYRVVLKRSGLKTPRVELQEMGPSMDFTVRRSKLAAPDVMREASRVPSQYRPRKIKNISTDAFGKSGAVHFGRQDFTRLVTKKMKGLGGKRKKKAAATTTTIEGEQNGGNEEAPSNKRSRTDSD